MLDARSIEATLRQDLALHGDRDLLVFARLPNIGAVEGGAQALVLALAAVARTLVMPAFTYQTQIIPAVGPSNNGLDYGKREAQNAFAEIFRPDLPVHPDIGSVSEALRRWPGTLRSTHPVLSFVARGPHAKATLSMQSRQNPFGPVAYLEARSGATLIIGGDMRDNCALHLAVQRAGRKRYIRWALTPRGVEELPNMPTSARGFNAIWGDVVKMSDYTQLGAARAELITLRPMLQQAEARMRADPDFMAGT